MSKTGNQEVRKLNKAEIMRRCKCNQILILANRQRKLAIDLSCCELSTTEKNLVWHVDFVRDLTEDGRVFEVVVEMARLFQPERYLALEKLWVFMNEAYTVITWKGSSKLWWQTPPMRPREDLFEQQPQHMSLAQVMTLQRRSVMLASGDRVLVLEVEDRRHQKLWLVCPTEEDRTLVYTSFMKLTSPFAARAAKRDLVGETVDMGNVQGHGFFMAVLTALIVTAMWAVATKRRALRSYRYRDGFAAYEDTKATTTPRPARMPIIQDRYSKAKVPSSLDAIVVGSGMGGLGVAAILSRMGWRVLVLEQHDRAGGATHTFEDMGVEFDTGTHYVGSIDPQCREYMELMGIGEDVLQWDAIGTEESGFVYDKVAVGKDGSFQVSFPATRARFIAELVRKFPNEPNLEAQLGSYLDLCERATKLSQWFYTLKVVEPQWLGSLLIRIALFFGDRDGFMRRNTTDVIDTLISNKLVQRVLCGQWGDHGVLPDSAPFYMHSQIVMHYLNGALFPRGGSAKIAEGLVTAIEQSGGRVLVKAAVAQVLVVGGKAAGVRLASGDEFRAPVVVSNIGFFNTRDKLLDAATVAALPENWRRFEVVAQAQRSVTMCFLFAALDGTVAELQLPANNVWSWPDVTETTTYTERFQEVLQTGLHDRQSRPVTFIAFPCAKESTWHTRYPGKSNALVLAMVNFADFEPWAHMKSSDRDADAAYQAVKAQWQAKLEAELYAYYPQLQGKVTGTTVGTPLSYNTYLNADKGEVFGLEMGKWRFTPTAFDVLRPSTPIPGFYQTGQDIVAIGIMGALMSGVVTAHNILGFGQVPSLATGHFDLFADCVRQGVVRPPATMYT
ncbi:hypothetical protein ACHHYP_07096 [Achlya hypogyna]|uniref:Amine oxidase domain-containing protein n=1 Tax=Achlya hypogyna TaxID=1202772 RepID=A0A1V9ZMS0_ACHHY|nr:hypothetical protein ACHHYP_07096 [Achlya hypogyna]